MNKLRIIFALVLTFGGFALSFATGSVSKACPAGVLGTSRTLITGTQGGLEVGLKTYPRSLTLGDHEVALTFDDGPNAATTPVILDALAQQCVKASFFLIGRNAQALPQLARREFAEGHTVGHHSFSHPAQTLRGMTPDAAVADITKGFQADDIAVYGSAGTQPRVPFFRYPGFASNPDADQWLARHNIGVFGADVWASDWETMTPQAELALLMERLEKTKGGIVLLHDSKASTAKMLPGFLSALKSRGYHIVQIVPGPGRAPVKVAPGGWTSATERIIAGLGHPAGAGPRRPAAHDEAGQKQDCKTKAAPWALVSKIDSSQKSWCGQEDSNLHPSQD